MSCILKQSHRGNRRSQRRPSCVFILRRYRCSFPYSSVNGLPSTRYTSCTAEILFDSEIRRLSFKLVRNPISNIPPWEAEILMSRNQPLRARKFEDYRHHTICEWLLPAHRVFGDIGRDVSGENCQAWIRRRLSGITNPSKNTETGFSSFLIPPQSARRCADDTSLCHS